MSTLTIIEGQGVGKTPSADIQAMMLPFLTLSRVTFTSTAGYSTGTGSNTNLVYLYTDASVSVLASTTSSASVTSTTGFPLVASTGMYFSVPQGKTIYFSAVAIS